MDSNVKKIACVTGASSGIGYATAKELATLGYDIIAVARRMDRLKELEELALSYPGVLKTYAIQAGRELRVMVESEKVSDEKASELSFNISQKIQNDMTYPGQVKVTVIRETRAVNVAK